jgi:hypothetical protein
MFLLKAMEELGECEYTSYSFACGHKKVREVNTTAYMRFFPEGGSVIAYCTGG